jgi:nucleotidyltransferase substrate binding protein (TIGR01987 family)
MKRRSKVSLSEKSRETTVKEIRWRQRLENLLKAYALLEEAVEAPGLSRLEMEGLIQRFEYTFELSWKTLKDYLEAQGIPTAFPREVIKQAFKTGLLVDGETWLEMLEVRNQLSHTYDETTFNDSVTAVRGKYFPAITQLVTQLKDAQ